MPITFTHAAVPLALGLGLGSRIIPPRLLACGAACAMLPDLDVLAFHFGIPYASQFGHRGFAHSLLIAFAVALAGASCHRWLQGGFWRCFWFLLAAIGSHGLLDTLTNGGLGIALLWPWSDQRYFAPFQPIEVAPFGLNELCSERGLTVLKSELAWVWLPAIIIAIIIMLARWFRASRIPDLSKKTETH